MSDIYVTNHSVYLNGIVVEPNVELPNNVDGETVKHLLENNAIRLVESKVDVVKTEAKPTSKATAKAVDSEV